MPIHVVLYRPEIPASTGNIARTCVATNVALHLVKPLGFSTDDKMLKRAGLDYWQYLDLHYYDSLSELFTAYPDGQFYYVETFGDTFHSDFDYSDPEADVFFIFGGETKGVPVEVMEKYKATCLRIPMTTNVRSLNLSNAAAVLVYEALRQQNYLQLK